MMLKPRLLGLHLTIRLMGSGVVNSWFAHFKIEKRGWAMYLLTMVAILDIEPI